MPRVWNKRDPNCPKNAVYIGRPSKWGNPFKVGAAHLYDSRLTIKRGEAVLMYHQWVYRMPGYAGWKQQPPTLDEIKRELRGKDLVCWCAPNACHGDVLLKIANS